MEWNAPPKPAELTETRLIEAILQGHFPIGSQLPAERDLANRLGVTRPTLREALQRLARDGWIEIRHGRPTRVRNYWQEGNLAVLGAVIRYSENLPDNFVTNLLSVRTLLAPAYIRLAVQNHGGQVAHFLERYPDLPDTPEAFAAADWQLHHQLSVLSDNPVFTLILNGFCDFYQDMAQIYFRADGARETSRDFYLQLLSAARRNDAEEAEAVTHRVMAASVDIWQSAFHNFEEIRPEVF